MQWWCCRGETAVVLTECVEEGSALLVPEADCEFLCSYSAAPITIASVTEIHHDKPSRRAVLDRRRRSGATFSGVLLRSSPPRSCSSLACCSARRQPLRARSTSRRPCRHLLRLPAAEHFCRPTPPALRCRPCKPALLLLAVEAEFPYFAASQQDTRAPLPATCRRTSSGSDGWPSSSATAGSRPREPSSAASAAARSSSIALTTAASPAGPRARAL